MYQIIMHRAQVVLKITKEGGHLLSMSKRIFEDAGTQGIPRTL